MRKKWFVRLMIAIFAVLAAGSGAFVAWAATPSGTLMDEARAALQSDELVSVSTEDWLVFAPKSGIPKAGFIYYPGGRVQAEAYAPTARALAEAGYLAVITPMPLNLAVFNASAADEVIAKYPEVKRWAIGGHSLGGSMAARYAAEHLGKVQGLAIIAAYPEASNDLSGRTDLAVISLYGERDGLARPSQVEGSKHLLPANAQFVKILGGNHAQFGWYGKQDRDNDATISHAEQQMQVNQALLSLMLLISE
ncbi:MAG: alpha/beta hydrolase [Anaerolineae bacterium]